LSDNAYYIRQRGQPGKEKDPPPPQLLLAWTAGGTSVAKARGRSGPYPALVEQPAVPTPSADASVLIQAIMTPIVAALVNIPHSLASSTPPAAQTIPALASSPPPMIDDDLSTCLQDFGASKNIAGDVIERAINGLSEVEYTPDGLRDITPNRLEELTGLAEGRCMALKRFASSWSEKVEGKRTRRRMK
jgi:hypothetical protein